MERNISGKYEWKRTRMYTLVYIYVNRNMDLNATAHTDIDIYTYTCLQPRQLINQVVPDILDSISN